LVDDLAARKRPSSSGAQPISPVGLSNEEAARRRAAQGDRKNASTRSYASIVRANVFTVFNVILAGFGTLTLAFGEWRDALFLGVVVANATIGSAQEIRAKRALDALAAFVAPAATVIRDGERRTVGVDDVVTGDLVEVEPGDQFVADGVLQSSNGLQVDESVLTGESRPVSRSVGDEVRSGAFAVEGMATYLVTAAGPDSYAAHVTGQARSFRHPRSPLERSLNVLLLVLVAVLVPLGALLGYALWERSTRLSVAIATSVAAGVTLVPEGLILLASLTYAVSAMRMARRGALVQQLSAIESLAAVDVLCLDKTGTLTDPDLEVRAFVPTEGFDEATLRGAAGAFAAASPTRNATIRAIASSSPVQPGRVLGSVPFSPERRWSAVEGDAPWWVLGAPELFELGSLRLRAAQEAHDGRRVLVLATLPEQPSPDRSDELRNADPAGLIVLAEHLRANARETVAFFREQGVRLIVISGDQPETAASIARDAGIATAMPPLDGRELPTGDVELRAALERCSVIGRISPDGKRRVVEALTAAGDYVGMVGDGINDVPALKRSRLAIAQGTGTQMARAVADIVLVHGDFAAVPAMVIEGRKVLRNVQRVTKLFVTKSAFAVFLILSIGLTPTAYPLLPRHLTLAASLTIGIPSFFLALAPSIETPAHGGYLREVARFAVPAGTAAGLGVLSSYLFALNVAHLGLLESRTVATTTLVLVGLMLILGLEAQGRRRGAGVSALCLGLAVLYAVVLAVPYARSFFALALPSPAMLAVAAAGTCIAIAGLWLSDDRFVPWLTSEPPLSGAQP